MNKIQFKYHESDPSTIKDKMKKEGVDDWMVRDIFDKNLKDCEKDQEFEFIETVDVFGKRMVFNFGSGIRIFTFRKLDLSDLMEMVPGKKKEILKTFI